MSERHLRKWDIAYITAFLILCGTVYTMAKHPLQWDQNTIDIADLKPRVDSLESSQKADRAVNQAQMTLIIRELDGIHREVKIAREASRADNVHDVAKS